MSEITPTSQAFDQILENNRSGRRWPWALILVMCTGLAVIAFSNPRQSDRPIFETVPLEKRDLVATVTATGQLRPTLQVEVGSEISGILAEVSVDANDIIEAGQVLARIDTARLEQQAERGRAALLSAQAQLAQAEATRVEAQAQLRRFEEVARLSDGKVPSATELDTARAAEQRALSSVAAAEAAVAEARASLLTQEIDLEKSVIRSPISGIVLSRQIDPGQTVAASFQAPVLFTIGQDLRKMDLRVYVSEADVGKVTKGQPANFTVDAWPGTEFEATVKKISFGSQTVENVVSYEAELEVDNEGSLLRPGMTATATIRVAEQQDVWAVPSAALRFNPPAEPEGNRGGFSFLPRPPEMEHREAPDGGPGVYVLREGALARELVEIGLTDGRWVEIKSPRLKADEPIVVDMLEETS